MANYNINIFDTSVGTDNLGDIIIMDAIYDVIDELFSFNNITIYKTHKEYSSYNMSRSEYCQLGFVGGTNILPITCFNKGNWKITVKDNCYLRNLVLLGCGWRGHNHFLDFLFKKYSKDILSSQYMHSVRDIQTYEILSKYIPNVIYTGCPTMWGLTPQKCKEITDHKAENVVLSLTCYKPNPKSDKSLFSLLRKHYKKVYFWPQMHEDIDYAKNLGILNDLIIIPPLISRYNELLENSDVDVIGSRLHGGIRALQKNKRSLVICVDNRAREMANETYLPIAERSEIDKIESWILNPVETKIKLPTDTISLWKTQFINN